MLLVNEISLLLLIVVHENTMLAPKWDQVFNFPSLSILKVIATYKSDWCSYHEKMREEYVNVKCLTYANSVWDHVLLLLSLTIYQVCQETPIDVLDYNATQQPFLFIVILVSSENVCKYICLRRIKESWINTKLGLFSMMGYLCNILACLIRLVQPNKRS